MFFESGGNLLNKTCDASRLAKTSGVITMNEPLDEPQDPKAREKEYPDLYNQDEYEEVPTDDIQPRRQRLPARRKPSRKPPPPRHYDED